MKWVGNYEKRIAFGFIKDTLPDVVILDVNLPLASGIEVLEFLRQQDNGDSTRAIVFTGDILARNAPQLALADVVLDKPFDVQTLLDALEVF